MRKLTISAIVLALLAGPALAQQPRQQQGNPSQQAEEEAKSKNADAIDRQYKATLDRTRKDVAPVRTDPWSNMRSADDGKAKR